MKKVFIIIWKDKSRLGFDFDYNSVFETKEEAEKEVVTLSDKDKTQYTVKEVDEVFIYLFTYLDDVKLAVFTNDKEDLEKVYDFFKNVSDERLIKKYLDEAISIRFYTFDRIKFINREIGILEDFKK